MPALDGGPAQVPMPLRDAADRAAERMRLLARLTQLAASSNRTARQTAPGESCASAQPPVDRANAGALTADSLAPLLDGGALPAVSARGSSSPILGATKRVAARRGGQRAKHGAQAGKASSAPPLHSTIVPRSAGEETRKSCQLLPSLRSVCRQPKQYWFQRKGAASGRSTRTRPVWVRLCAI